MLYQLSYSTISVGIAKIVKICLAPNFYRNIFELFAGISFMTSEKMYISVILPLRLEWNPCYRADVSMNLGVGGRVRVRFARRYYVAVVYEVGIVPSAAEDKILDVESVESLEAVSREEIRLWEFVSSYYMCTIGEVYKAAYPSMRVSGEKTGLRMMNGRKEKAEKERAALMAKAEMLEEKLRMRTAVLDGMKRTDTKKYLDLKSRIERLAVQKADVNARLSTFSSGESENSVNLHAVGPSIAEYSAPELTAVQNKAMTEILEAFDRGKTVLLDGVTGSGKTEIYISVALKTLASGHNVLYMVPEIALSRQLEYRLRSYFGESLAVFHSAESPVRKREVASAIRTAPYVVLGTRSSVFLPHHDLGLVIVDEEHDFSYKQESPAPRYNGRDTAAVLAAIHSSALLLGSATPSFESMYNSMTGKYAVVRLKERYYRGDDSRVEIIDTISERRKNGMEGDFSLKLISHIRETLGRGEQVLVLRGRKAYAPAVQCEGCGLIPRCGHCDVPLSYHKDREALMCHYCGRTVRFSGICPECGGKLRPMGSGTQKIEEELSALFPSARVARLDGDNSSSSSGIIKDFAEGKTDILVGTQIVAKGFDFANLVLVAVIQSDTLLGQFDFRADEKAYQLLEQLKGRGGRRGKESLFVIQTAQPDHPVYRRLLEGGDSSFLGVSELELRRRFAYPPFTRLIIFILRDPDLSRLEKISAQLSAGLRTLLADDSRVSEPYPPPVDRQSDMYIRNVRVTLERDRNLPADKKKIYDYALRFEKESKWPGYLAVDVDPV